MKLRELTVGWLYTTSGIDEKSFPIGIKNVNMKELVVIFPLLILTISFAFKNIMIAISFIAPVLFIIFYEEKSMDEFQYVYHFMKFYLNDFLAPKEKKEKSKEEKEKRIIIIKKYEDEIVITVSAVVAIINANAFINTFQLKFYYPTSLIQVLLFAIGTGVAIGFIISKIRK
jgi:hypothetical protein